MEFDMSVVEDFMDLFFADGAKHPHGLFCKTLQLNDNDDDDDGVDANNHIDTSNHQQRCLCVTESHKCGSFDKPGDFLNGLCAKCALCRSEGPGSHPVVHESQRISNDYNSWIDLDEVNTEEKYTSWDDPDAVDSSTTTTVPNYDSDGVNTKDKIISQGDSDAGNNNTPHRRSDYGSCTDLESEEGDNHPHKYPIQREDKTDKVKSCCSFQLSQKVVHEQSLLSQKVVRERSQPNRFAVEAVKHKKKDKRFKGVIGHKKRMSFKRYSRKQMQMLHDAYEDYSNNTAAWKSNRSCRSQNMEALCCQTGLDICQISKWFYARGRNRHCGEEEDCDNEEEERDIPAATRPLYVPPSGRGRGRYPAWILKELSRYLADYVADPVSWNSDTCRRMQLSERTGLTQKQVRQYFANHKAKLQLGFRR